MRECIFPTMRTKRNADETATYKCPVIDLRRSLFWECIVKEIPTIHTNTSKRTLLLDKGYMWEEGSK